MISDSDKNDLLIVPDTSFETNEMCVKNNSIETDNASTEKTNPNLLSNDTHEKLYNYFINELNEKNTIINNLQSKINELLTTNEEIQTKIDKFNNIGLLIKLKENLTNKQNEIKTELYDIEETNNTNLNNTNLNNTSSSEFTEPKNSNGDEDNKSTLKLKKRPNMFRRHF